MSTTGLVEAYKLTSLLLKKINIGCAAAYPAHPLPLPSKKTLFIMNLIDVNHLNNYFDFHVCLSFRASVRPSVRACVWKITQIPAILSQNVTNKSCLVCVMSEKYASWVTLRPQWDRYRRGEAKVRLLNFKTTW